ncbi:MAG: hypothetical protein Aurels2KO_00180 [Aureliella sp.]
MKTPAKIVSLIALCAVTLPCLLYFAGSMELDAVKMAAIVGTAVWFVSTPLWMSR